MNTTRNCAKPSTCWGQMEPTASWSWATFSRWASGWGNHDVGLCFEPTETVRQRYSAAVLDFMSSLQPRLEIDGCLFTHVEPWLDPHKIEDLWYVEGPPDSAEKLART